MISFLVLRAGFPVMFVPVAVMTIPFLLGLWAKDIIIAVFSFLNYLIRNFWNFLEYRMPDEWFHGKVTDAGNGIFHHEEPTTFYWIWDFFTGFRFPEYGSSVIVWFMVIVAIVEFFVLIKLLKRAARQGQMPNPMSDLKAMEAMKGRQYDD